MLGCVAHPCRITPRSAHLGSGGTKNRVLSPGVGQGEGKGGEAEDDSPELKVRSLSCCSWSAATGPGAVELQTAMVTPASAHVARILGSDVPV